MKDLSHFELNPNPLVQFLDKPQSGFTKADLIKFIEANHIQMINFRYVGEDSRLKTLNFVINSKNYLDNLLRIIKYLLFNIQNQESMFKDLML